ncbi:Protein of unknown function [Tistlia consotensis]|uniref:DUF3306 domain-containing protein n=1 Tax=Tistlia consotensis USBA 355 TaxID=560819 RepID=A0A1Y6CJE7_9PROT|nr:DUF3306 domain-containing protein [Tistlia consotensis]SMF55618.1 Protein of unknown function [Tistlia consotensis USBA 355]SNR88836.1 Protein of unknown function [Tistlia consotensis]
MAEQQDGPRREGALARWSRLKRREATEERPATAAEASVEPPAGDPAETDAPMAAEPVAPDAVEEEVDLSTLPDVESLGYESDFTPFLRQGVPEELQRLALRKLWSSSPVLANIDGLNDYDLDYDKTDPLKRVGEFLMSREERSGPPPERPPEAPRADAEAPASDRAAVAANDAGGPPDEAGEAPSERAVPRPEGEEA